jgi:hypothetical protein
MNRIFIANIISRVQIRLIDALLDEAVENVKY